MPPGLHPVWRWALAGVLVVQVGVIGFTAVFCALRLPYFSPIDEAAHYTYIQQVAEHGTLPVLGRTEVSPQTVSIELGRYPHLLSPSVERGLGRLSYEAFQPPLYYVAAAPVFLITGNYVDKIYALRLFDVVLLLGALALAGRLCRAVLKQRWLLGLSMVMVFFMLPGVLVRMVVISNLALTVPMALLFTTELWMAWQRHSLRRLTVAGVVLGLCMLTEIELVLLAPIFALVVVAEARRRWSLTRVLGLVGVTAIPLVLVAPWLAFNEAHYRMLTAATIAIHEQAYIVNPHHLHYSLGQLPNQTAALLNPTVPAEWGASLAHQPGLAYLYQLLGVLLIPAAVVMILGTGRRLWSVRTAILGLPWVLNVVEMWYIHFGQQWQVDVRYTYATVPILLVLAADATQVIRSRYLPVLISIGAVAATMTLWSYYVFSYSGQFAIR
jgi:4-amino-4-deoxy-L-arabinose transferase-like glycosyltransferase